MTVDVLTEVIVDRPSLQVAEYAGHGSRHLAEVGRSEREREHRV